MATTINITKQADGTWQGSFNSTGTRTIVQVERQENAPLYLNISADNGQHNVIYQPPKDFKNQILLIDIAEGALVTVVSHSAVTKAQYIASELDYYTKAEVDELIRGIHQFEPVVVDVLPTASEDTMFKFYFVPKYNPETSNASDEYITVRYGTEGSYTYQWERIGDTTIDLSGYATLLYVDGKFIPIPAPLPSNTDGAIIENIVQDYDGNWYDGIIWNNKIWLLTNLRTKHYADGTQLEEYSEGIKLPPYYRYPSGTSQSSDEETLKKNGLLYNYYAALKYDSGHEASTSDGSNENPSGIQGLAPTGWHIPSRAEFGSFFNYIAALGSAYNLGTKNNWEESDCKIAKAVASDNGWKTSSRENCPGNAQENNNITKFSAFPTNSYSACFITTTSSTTVYNKFIMIDVPNNQANILGTVADKGNPFSIRCVCDMTATEWFAANGGSRYLKNTPQGLVWAKIAKVAETNSYNDLGDKPTLPTSAQLLPAVTSTDNGKILIVDNGAWVTESIPVVDAVLYPNSNN